MALSYRHYTPQLPEEKPTTPLLYHTQLEIFFSGFLKLFRKFSRIAVVYHRRSVVPTSSQGLRRVFYHIPILSFRLYRPHDRVVQTVFCSRKFTTAAAAAAETTLSPVRRHRRRRYYSTKNDKRFDQLIDDKNNEKMTKTTKKMNRLRSTYDENCFDRFLFAVVMIVVGLMIIMAISSSSSSQSSSHSHNNRIDEDQHCHLDPPLSCTTITGRIDASGTRRRRQRHKGRSTSRRCFSLSTIYSDGNDATGWMIGILGVVDAFELSPSLLTRTRYKNGSIVRRPGGDGGGCMRTTTTTTTEGFSTATIISPQLVLPTRRRCRRRNTYLSSSSSSTTSIGHDGGSFREERDVVSSHSIEEYDGTTATDGTSNGRVSGKHLTEKHKQVWQQMFEEIQQYQDDNNGSSYPPPGTPLRNWADTQRKNFNQDVMYTYRIELLNSTDFQWSKPRGGPRLDWDQMYGRLVEYKERWGDTKVPRNNPEDPQLGKWCYNQKTTKKNGKLDPEQKANLDDIGFVFDKVVPNDERWNGVYDRLVEYWKKNNSTIIPRSHEDDPELARWVKDQRNYYRRNYSRMTPEKIEKLEAIGFVWNAPEAVWLEMYNRLNEYRQEEGDADVPQKYKKDPKLGSWVNWQRRQYKNGKLSPDRIEMLEAIGFKWSVIQSQAEKSKMQQKLW